MNEEKLTYKIINRVITKFQHDITHSNHTFEIIKEYLEKFRKLLDLDIVFILQPIIIGGMHVLEIVTKNNDEYDNDYAKKYLIKYGYAKRVKLINEVTGINEYNNEKNIESPLIDFGKYKHSVVLSLNNILRNDGGNGVLVLANKTNEINKTEIFYDLLENLRETISLSLNNDRYKTLLKRESDFIQKSFNNLRDAICIFDNKGIIIKINKAFTNLTGVIKEKAVGSSIFKVLQLKNHSKIVDYLKVYEKDIIDKENSNNMYVKYEKNDGSIVILKKYFSNITEKYDLFHMLMLEDITQEINQFEEMKFIGLHDSLTGLYNRNYYIEYIKTLRTKSNYPISVIVGDINGLKLMNDIFSHSYGDRIIIDIANILKQHCIDGEVLRVGGDEFYIFLNGTDEHKANEYIKNVNYSCSLAFKKYNFVGISLGANTIYDKTEHFDTTIRKAEASMYYNKSISHSNIKNHSLEKFKEMYKKKVKGGKEHIQRLSKISKDFAKYLNLRKSETLDLIKAIEIHDIGKVAIDESIINTKQQYTDEQIDIIQTHCYVGFKIASLSYETAHLSRIILSHHENWNGSGYPQGLIGDQLPYLVRILTLLDFYDIYKYGNNNKEACNSIDEIKEKLINNRAKYFDPELVDKFIKFLNNSKKVY